VWILFAISFAIKIAIKKEIIPAIRIVPIINNKLFRVKL